MTFKDIDFEKRAVKNSLSLKGIKHHNSWKAYYDSYSYVIRVIINGGLSEDYFFNSKCRPILFLIRHNWELYLKLLLKMKNEEVPSTHDFQKLFSALERNHINHEVEKDIFNKLNFEGDGACFRYFTNKDGDSYFDSSSKIDLEEILIKYKQNRINQTQRNQLAILCDDFQPNGKTKWDLTLHLGEATQLMLIKTQYDQLIEFLVDGVLKDIYVLSKVYLPLLFLVRHSLEIGLKYNISEVQRKSDLIKDKDYSNEHSLSCLYNCYSDFLNKIEEKKLNKNTLNDLRGFQVSYTTLNSTIHNLDKNSNYFRFPGQTAFKLNNKTLYNIIKLYYFTDKFITFTNDVLEEEGIFD